MIVIYRKSNTSVFIFILTGLHIWNYKRVKQIHQEEKNLMGKQIYSENLFP